MSNYDRLQTYHKRRVESEDLVIKWLFTLTTGTLAGGLTLISSRGLNDYLLTSIICSGSGILCLLVRATWSYYRFEFGLYGAFKRDVAAFDDNTMTGADLRQRDRDRAKGSHLLHILGWLGGLLFLAAFVIGFRGLLKTAPKPPIERPDSVPATAMQRQCTNGAEQAEKLLKPRAFAPDSAFSSRTRSDWNFRNAKAQAERQQGS